MAVSIDLMFRLENAPSAYPQFHWKSGSSITETEIIPVNEFLLNREEYTNFSKLYRSVRIDSITITLSNPNETIPANYFQHFVWVDCNNTEQGYRGQDALELPYPRKNRTKTFKLYGDGLSRFMPREQLGTVTGSKPLIFIKLLSNSGWPFEAGVDYAWFGHAYVHALFKDCMYA